MPQHEQQQGKYRAPALQKGLEILELLAGAADAMPMVDISDALGRSVSEIFRMLQVLEQRQYISRSGEGYRLTNRLFALGMAQPLTQDLLGNALPVMRELAKLTRQSCHLAMASGAAMVVVAGVESPGLLGFAVRTGYQRPLIHSASGHILMAFQSRSGRDEMFRAADLAHLQFDRVAFSDKLENVKSAGYITMPSPMLTAITDISAPILKADVAIAALTMPFVDGPGTPLGMDDAREVLLDMTATVTRSLNVSS